MKRLLILLPLFIYGCAALSPLQRSKLLTVSNLIETSKFAEAKEVVEEMIADEESVKWSRTWYYRGLLCQNAYQEGIKKNDKKLYELYPDQLYVALESYEKALALDKGGRVERQIAPKYVLLANEFQKTGEQYFRSNRFTEALRAFEKAYKISESPILEVEADDKLIYNTGLAAWESREWDKAVQYLEKLHKNKYSVNATHLLYSAKMEKADTTAAEKILEEGIQKYDENEVFVLLLTELYFKGNETEEALRVISEAEARDTLNAGYPFTKGLVYQKSSQYTEAIEAYKKAHELSPKDPAVMLSIATCYYNIGVEIDENARNLMSSRQVQEEREKSAAAYDLAVSWLDKVYENGSTDQEILLQVSELYRALRVTDKARGIETLMR
jgi:tetratricopeptide (TPR) repeat protein